MTTLHRHRGAVRSRHHAPDFCLPTVDGASLCLRDLLGAGPILLWFYRGHG